MMQTMPDIGYGTWNRPGYAVIPSAGSPERIAENLAAGQISLSTDHLEQIDALDRGMRLIDGPWCPVWDRA